MFGRLFRRRPHPLHEKAGEVRDANAWLAADFIARQREHLERAELPFRLTHDMRRAIEMFMLWGVFHDLVADGPAFPANGYDRIAIHLAHHLTNDEGMSFAQALEHAKAIDTAYNEGDELFDDIEKRGRQAFAAGDDAALTVIIQALSTSGLLAADAYEVAPAR